jgi:NAD+ synthase (glutamine-hydrolysing)
MGILVKVGLAQINTTVGDFAGNTEKILEACRRLASKGADIVLTPELALTGYPPRDLVFKSRFVPENLEALDRIEQETGATALVVGFVAPNTGAFGAPFHNAAAILEKGKPRQVVHKSLLPTYDVFDEARYFEPARETHPATIRGQQFAVTICEDIWTAENLPRRLYDRSLLAGLVSSGATGILNLSASPFQAGKPARRAAMLGEVAHTHALPLAYCNAVGGNDQLVFDGNSLVVGPSGRAATAAPFAEDCLVADFSDSPGDALCPPPAERDDLGDVHDALVLGIRDYMGKCGFRTCVLGLSGGIDSAITAALAVRAVGAENVTGVLMPSVYSSKGSVDDALALASTLGIRSLTIPIQPAFEQVAAQLRPAFGDRPADTTEENLQARLRGLTLMALSNKFGSLLLTTGNKSELAVGYCTLYGDMAGGLAAISDVPKTLVYRLAGWINAQGREIIPAATIAKPPSAELRPGQTDQDTLPDYPTLDAILALYVEENLSGSDIIARGFDAGTVRWILRRVDLNEYKREQAAPGIKVTGRAFGLGRRMPVAQRFVH